MAETKGKSLGELFSDLTRETSNLVRQEVQLAKTEMSQKASVVGKSAGLAIAGALMGLGAFGAFVATLILLLSNWLEPWLAALVVTMVLGGLAGVLVMMGIGAIKKANGIAPKHTVETLKEDVQWAKEQTK